MCPACLTTVALTVAGATSTGGLAALLAAKLRRKSGTQESRRSLRQRLSLHDVPARVGGAGTPLRALPGADIDG